MNRCLSYSLRERWLEVGRQLSKTHVCEAKSPLQKAPSPTTRVRWTLLQSGITPLQSLKSSGPRACARASACGSDAEARAVQFRKLQLALVGPRCRGNGRTHSQHARRPTEQSNHHSTSTKMEESPWNTKVSANQNLSKLSLLFPRHLRIVWYAP